MKHACRIGCVKNVIYSEAPLQFSNNHERTNSLDSRPQRERRPGIHCMRMRVHYPKKGVIRVFVDTVSKINRILFVF